MGRRKKQIVLEEIKIIDTSSSGKSVGKSDELVVFVEGCVPGDIVDVKITRKKKGYLEGYPVHFHHYSEDRVEAFCKHFGTCGGCKWQNLSYEKQLFYKHHQVVQNLKKISGAELPEAKPILSSELQRYYRNKLEFTFSPLSWLTNDEIKSEGEFERRGLGLHLPGRFDKILDLQECHLQAEPSNKIRLAVKDFGREHNLDFFNIKEKHGFLRNLIIRTTSTNEVMVIVQFFENRTKEINLLMEYLKTEFPEITSLMYVVNPKGNETYNDLEIVNYAGKDYISEEMEGLEFRVGPKSFYQTNSKQALRLYQVARTMAKLTGEEVVYDLYTGTGTIANFVAKKAKKVIGLEYVEAAIEDAKVNSSINQIENTYFEGGDMKDVLNAAFIQKHGTPDVIITDPPRAGMHENVVKTILKAAPQRIVYVSCNPATQARDLSLLKEDYTVEEIQPVDMFPHTYHVENVLSLIRKK